MLGSAHLGPLHEVALAWLGRLRGAHAALLRWLDAERGAAHLARVAAACPELSRVAPEAAKLLPAAEEALRSLAAEAQECEQGALAPRGALEVLGAAGTHEALARVAEALGPLHAAVRSALAAKRQACPRLHALGDTELLELLGAGIGGVELLLPPLLPRLFSAADRPRLSRDMSEIEAVRMTGGEVLELARPVRLRSSLPLPLPLP